MKGLKQKIANLPESTGIYLMKDSTGEIIYIGKAKSLKKRVSWYFNRALDAKTQTLVSKVADIEYIVTASEAQARILEATLIKDKQPQYNIDLKDDKSFPLIKITKEEFPVISVCRNKDRYKDKKAVYYGPYTSSQLLRKAMKIIRQIFGFRSCGSMPKKPCLYYRLKQCPAPCIGEIGINEYKEIIGQIRLFLDSRYAQLLDRLAQKMKEEARDKKFEEAAKTRDQINALSAIAENRYTKGGISELEDLKLLLGLDRLPLRIEAFDISNIQGKEATGSMVSFYNGRADKNNYRRFRIKTVDAADDYAMIREAVRRRYTRVTNEKLALPDLILIDGGRSHLLAVKKELGSLHLDIPLVSMAKVEENIYIKDRVQPIKLNQDTPALNLMRRVRNEAHRFAVAYHHILRRKKIIGR